MSILIPNTKNNPVCSRQSMHSDIIYSLFIYLLKLHGCSHLVSAESPRDPALGETTGSSITFFFQPCVKNGEVTVTCAGFWFYAPHAACWGRQCRAPVPGSTRPLGITATSDGGYSFGFETPLSIIPKECWWTRTFPQLDISFVPAFTGPACCLIIYV